MCFGVGAELFKRDLCYALFTWLCNLLSARVALSCKTSDIRAELHLPAEGAEPARLLRKRFAIQRCASSGCGYKAVEVAPDYRTGQDCIVLEHLNDAQTIYLVSSWSYTRTHASCQKAPHTYNPGCVASATRLHVKRTCLTNEACTLLMPTLYASMLIAFLHHELSRHGS